jgi:hypothetical protein
VEYIGFSNGISKGKLIDTGNTSTNRLFRIIGNFLNFYWIFGYGTFSEPMSIN